MREEQMEQGSLFAPEASGGDARPMRRPRRYSWEALACSIFIHYLTCRRAALAATRIYRCYHWVTTIGRLDPAALRAAMLVPAHEGQPLLPLQVALPGVAGEPVVPVRAARRGAPAAVTIRPYPQALADCRDALLAVVGADPALFSLALPAPDAPRFADLAQIAGRAPGVEILLAIDGARLIRLARSGAMPGARAPDAATSRPAVAHLLTDLTRSDAWKELWRADETPLLATLHLIAAQLRRLYPWVFVVDLPAPQQPEPWAPSGHYLIYATRAPDAVLLMNDFLADEECRCREAVWTTILPGDWFRARAAVTRAHLCAEARTALLELLSQRHAPFWPELRLRLVARAFGRLNAASYDALLRALLASGTVRCHWAPRRGVHPADELPGPRDRLERTC